MRELIPHILQIALILMILSVGLQAHWRDVASAAKGVHGIWRGVLAVNVAVPVTAVLMCMVIPLTTPVKIGIIVMAVSPLAPLVPGKLMRAGADTSRVVGLYALLVILSVVIVPATVALLSWLFPADATISVAAVGRLVLISILAPLAVGIAIASLAPALAQRLAKPVGLISNIALGVIVVALLVTQGRAMLALVGNGAVLVMAAAALSGIVAGHLLGGPSEIGRKSLALAAATRHPGIAALIAKTNFGGDHSIILAIVLFLLVSVLVSVAYQQWLKRRASGEGGAAAAT